MNPPAAPVLGMVLKGYPRISETFISNEILLLERQGFALRLFSMRQPRESFTHASVAKIRAPVDYLPETLLVPLPRLLYHSLQLAAKKPKIYAAALKGVLRRWTRTRKSATIKHFLQAGYLVHRLLPAAPVIHLHAHFAHSPASVAMFAAQLSGLSFSFTAHAKDIYTSDRKQLQEKIARARFVVTCTEYNRRHLMALSDGAPTPIYRVYHGIDTALFSGPPAVLAGPAPPYRILTVARLTAKKGLASVFKALRLLDERGIRLEHILIGDGEQRDRILALIKKLGLASVTRWLGTQPHEVVLGHYRRAHLFVLGCRVAPNGDRDGIPNVLMESMAMGVPVVATHISAIPELVQNEKTGLLVAPGNPADLAAAMRRLLTDEHLRGRIIAAARQRVIRDFDNRAWAAKLGAIYRHEIAALGAGPI